MAHRHRLAPVAPRCPPRDVTPARIAAPVGEPDAVDPWQQRPACMDRDHVVNGAAHRATRDRPVYRAATDPTDLIELGRNALRVGLPGGARLRLSFSDSATASRRSVAYRSDPIGGREGIAAWWVAAPCYRAAGPPPPFGPPGRLHAAAGPAARLTPTAPGAMIWPGQVWPFRAGQRARPPIARVRSSPAPGIRAVVSYRAPARPPVGRRPPPTHHGGLNVFDSPGRRWPSSTRP